MRPVVDAEYGEEGDRSPSAVIVAALAAAAGVPPVELPPLFEFDDPGVVDSLLDRPEGSRPADALLGFRVETWYVFVRDDGRIRICDATQPTEPRPVFESGTA